MRGKYKRKKERKKALPGPDLAAVPTSTNQESATEKKRTGERDREKQPPMRLFKPFIYLTQRLKSLAALLKRKFRYKIVLESTAVFAGLAVLIVYALQLQTMREQMKLDQRAWVSITVDPNIPQQDNVQILWPLHINNVGKSFANHIEGDFFATVFKKGESPQFDYSIGHPHRRINVGGIFPNEPLPQTSIRVERYGPHAPEPVLMTQELRQAIANNQQAIVVYGRITYRDIFGVDHWTQFCNGTGDALQFDAIKKCIDYNDADNNH